MAMKILFVGDIVGSPGREMLADYLPKMKKIYQPDAIIVNGENATNGKGLNEKHYHELIRLGVQVITMGNHTFAKKQIFDYIDENARIIRPANYPKETPGVGYTYIEVGKQKLAVINIQARTFMPSLDCPFTIIDKILQEIDANTWIFVDFHGEATSEKNCNGLVFRWTSSCCCWHTYPCSDSRCSDFTKRNSLYYRCRNDWTL